MSEAAAPFTDAVVSEINAERARAGVRPLKRSRPLSQVARSHSADIAFLGRLDHSSSDGTPMAARLRRWVPARRVGEAIALLPTTPARPIDAVQVWMTSPAHRESLLSPAFARIGVGRNGGFVTVDLASAR